MSLELLSAQLLYSLLRVWLAGANVIAAALLGSDSAALDEASVDLGAAVLLALTFGALLGIVFFSGVGVILWLVPGAAGRLSMNAWSADTVGVHILLYALTAVLRAVRDENADWAPSIAAAACALGGLLAAASAALTAGGLLLHRYQPRFVAPIIIITAAWIATLALDGYLAQPAGRPPQS
jgi:hypothetical protein